jgi:formylmethanofuran dehydrogenase subunit E
MKQYFPRCNLPTSKQRFSNVNLTLPEPVLSTHSCVLCGERNIHCTHKRKDGSYVCENCYRKTHVATIAKNKQWLWDHKEAEGCVFCEENDPRCLDYHHLHPKKKKFSIGSVSSTIPTQAIIIEMKKCVVICANCHRQIETLKL